MGGPAKPLRAFAGKKEASKRSPTLHDRGQRGETRPYLWYVLIDLRLY